MRADSSLVPEPVAPWNDPETGARALTTDEIKTLVEDFVAAAVRAETAGFDGVEVHAAHGYLIAQFLDADHNHRNDGYGGSLRERSRFLREIIAGIRSHTGPSFQVGLRLSMERYGIKLAEAKDLAEEMMLSGHIDYLDASLWDVGKLPAESGEDHRPLLIQVSELQRGRARLGVAGKVLSAVDAQRCLDAGVDFVSIGTGAILHHDFATQAMENPLFQAVTPPVSRDHLSAQAVGPAFIDYLEEIRSDFIKS
ncbi:2,4-dienoyl-CoA reductase-like NADH-dependent reductase (Old Yellow Enzyme family) [Paenarthrobacter nicotinovorans]|nr:2,4-dienoyl-CoA reductase-like NADH-dependent reductase (Old Yellow Enzyme family) [Paenarthrobacter nicotinovorans]